MAAEERGCEGQVQAGTAAAATTGVAAQGGRAGYNKAGARVDEVMEGSTSRGGTFVLPPPQEELDYPFLLNKVGSFFLQAPRSPNV
jgi:hypothetical protein